MKEICREFFGYTDKQKTELWNKAIFVFDTNVLLSLYRYTKKTRDILLEAMAQYKNRLWLPYQVAHEFSKNRTAVIFESTDRYKDLEKLNKTYIKQISDILRVKSDDEELRELENSVAEWTTNHKTQNIEVQGLDDDKILNKIVELFGKKIGRKYSEDEIEELKLEGKLRYDKKTPPGYKDASKEENEYGDYIIWKQIIEYAEQNSKNIILVTSDQKEDWWQQVKGRTIGPRFELIKEFETIVNRSFIMYTAERFIEEYTSSVGQKADSNILYEIRNIKDQNEKDIFYLHRNKAKHLENLEKEIIDDFYRLSKEKEIRKHKSIRESLGDRNESLLSLMNSLLRYGPDELSHLYETLDEEEKQLFINYVLQYYKRKAAED